jgi:hypothetical protein
MFTINNFGAISISLCDERRKRNASLKPNRDQKLDKASDKNKLYSYRYALKTIYSVNIKRL